MYDRFTARPGDRRHTRLGRRRRNARLALWLIAFAVSVGLIVAGFRLAAREHQFAANVEKVR